MDEASNSVGCACDQSALELHRLKGGKSGGEGAGVGGPGNKETLAYCGSGQRSWRKKVVPVPAGAVGKKIAGIAEEQLHLVGEENGVGAGRHVLAGRVGCGSCQIVQAGGEGTLPGGNVPGPMGEGGQSFQMANDENNAGGQVGPVGAGTTECPDHPAFESMAIAPGRAQ